MNFSSHLAQSHFQEVNALILQIEACTCHFEKQIYSFSWRLIQKGKQLEITLTNVKKKWEGRDVCIELKYSEKFLKVILLYIFPIFTVICQREQVLWKFNLLYHIEIQVRIQIILSGYDKRKFKTWHKNKKP